MAAAESMVAAMDSLWFHHVILFSHSQPSSSFPPLPQLHNISPRGEICTQETDVLEKESTATDDDDDLERATRLNLAFAKGRSHSSSSPISAQKRSRNRPPLKKSSSLKSSLMDLELEEVKGFMDLGFIFRRENLTKRIIHLVPGLQREEEDEDEDEDEDEYEEERKKEIIRPYLSEAWIVRRPNISQLMNDLRIPTVSTTADMKKHLRCWAHTVASAIHQES